MKSATQMIKINVEPLKQHLMDVGVVGVSQMSVADVVDLHQTLQAAGVFDRYYSCTRKIVYATMPLATRASYALEQASGIRNPNVKVKKDRSYNPYKCRYCYGYHIGGRK